MSENKPGAQPIVIVSGTINVDTFVDVDRFPTAGDTIIGAQGLQALGGKGANQAVACARTGATTVLLGTVGHDPQGDFALDELRECGVDIEHIARLQDPTGQAFIMNDATGENIIIVTSGANLQTSPARQRDTARHLQEHAQMRGTDVPIVLGQGELSPEHSAELPALARSIGARLVLNLAPVTTRDETLLGTADPLILNEGESADVLGLDRNTPLEEVTAALAEAVASGRFRSVVMTLGPAGAQVIEAGERRVTEVPGFPVNKIVDTTGAGDAFCGTLAGALAKGSSLLEACRLGSAAGALAVQQRGAAMSYADWQDIETLRAKGSAQKN